jgi:7-carboxy-7-deazaguanine synthase
VVKILDIKTPGSLEADKNHWPNISSLLPHDQIKFVICDQADYEWSKGIIRDYQLSTICDVLFSPSHHQTKPGELADWILKDQLPVRLQIQLHKYLWGDVPGR